MTSSIEIRNNTWTLLKHTAGSINKAAGKVDAKVYGPIVKEGTVQLSPQQSPQPKPLPKEDTNVFTIIGYIVVSLVVFAGVVALFIGYCSGHIKGRDIWGI